MKKECSTCLHNRRECSVTLGLACQNHEKWTPCTNLEYLQSLSAEDFAEWIYKGYYSLTGICAMICDDADTNCFFECKHNHMCVDEEYNFLVTGKSILKWLNSPVEVNE